MDVYQLRAGDPTPTPIHDLNPSTFPPVGLFWTVQLPEDSIEVQLGKGSASLQAWDVPILDYGNILNALFNGDNPPPVPGSVSFKVVWSGVNQLVKIRNTDPTFGGFARRIHSQQGADGMDGHRRRFHLCVGPAGDVVQHLCRNRPRAERLLF